MGIFAEMEMMGVVGHVGFRVIETYRNSMEISWRSSRKCRKSMENQDGSPPRRECPCRPRALDERLGQPLGQPLGERLGERHAPRRGGERHGGRHAAGSGTAAGDRWEGRVMSWSC